MSFFRKALGAFVELNEAEPAKVTRPFPTTPPEPVNFKSRTERAPGSTGPLAPVLLPEQVAKFEKHFDELFEASNLPGPDYFEWSKAVEALEPDIPGEESRMRAAYTSLKVQGMTKEKLVETARQYVRIVEADRKALEAEVDAKMKAEIKPLEESVAMLQKDVDSIEQQIAQLQASLPERRGAVTAAERNLAAAKERLGGNIEGYQVACSAMVERIEQDITKINTLL